MEENFNPELLDAAAELSAENPEKSYQIAFTGNGITLFKISIVNLILTIVTLGLYYPWAKATSLSYLYSKSTLEMEPFAFSGTGKEMFVGFIRAFLILIGIVCIYTYISYSGYPFPAFLFYITALGFIIPFAIHGSLKYRSAKSSWRGIRFGYTGDRNELLKLCIKGFLYTIFSFGLYAAWFVTNIRQYVLGHLKMGNAEFEFKGDGTDYFVINFKGYFLTIFTLGIYSFWWQKDRFQFFVDNIRLKHHEDKVVFRSNATGGDFFGLIIVNALILFFTLGLGFPWVIIRNLEFGCRHIELNGNINLDQLQQEQGDYSDATGADMGDLLDFGFTF